VVDNDVGYQNSLDGIGSGYLLGVVPYFWSQTDKINIGITLVAIQNHPIPNFWHVYQCP